jgi:DNA-binding CsgD family transcriptional regulator
MTDGTPIGEETAVLLGRLTPSERRCLELVDQGLQSKEIARVLDRSPNSIDTWLRSAARKLGVRDRYQAAKMLANATRMAEIGDVTPLSILRSQDPYIPAEPVSGDREASAGEGNGLDDLNHDRLLGLESRDSGRGRSWLEPSHPFAKFFGGENRLSSAQNILLIVGIAIALSIAFTLVMTSFLSLSRLLSP